MNGFNYRALDLRLNVVYDVLKIGKAPIGEEKETYVEICDYNKPAFNRPFSIRTLVDFNLYHSIDMKSVDGVDLYTGDIVSLIYFNTDKVLTGEIILSKIDGYAVKVKTDSGFDIIPFKVIFMMKYPGVKYKGAINDPKLREFIEPIKFVDITSREAEMMAHFENSDIHQIVDDVGVFEPKHKSFINLDLTFKESSQVDLNTQVEEKGQINLEDIENILLKAEVEENPNHIKNVPTSKIDRYDSFSSKNSEVVYGDTHCEKQHKNPNDIISDFFNETYKEFEKEKAACFENNIEPVEQVEPVNIKKDIFIVDYNDEHLKEKAEDPNPVVNGSTLVLSKQEKRELLKHINSQNLSISNNKDRERDKDIENLKKYFTEK